MKNMLKSKDRTFIGDLLEEFKEGTSCKVAGRVMAKRDIGRISFLDIRDSTGSIQILLRDGDVITPYEEVKKIKRGDLAYLEGTTLLTKTGERSIKANSFNTVVRITNNIPNQRHVLSKENQYNQRGLDMIVCQESFDRLKKRNTITKEIRKMLYDIGYEEVETPILCKETCTSIADDFVTFSKGLQSKLYLRKTPELKLKQLIVGGYDKIFELGKNFRNESVSRLYHPEFTVLEACESYADYKDMLNLTKKILCKLDDILGTPKTNPSNAKDVEFYDFIEKSIGKDATNMSTEQIKNIIPEELRNNYITDVKGYYLYDLFKLELKNHQNENIILHGIPKEISVLGCIESSTGLVEEFRYFVGENLIANGITELNDYNEQKDRVLMQSKNLHKSLDENDNIFLDILKFGMPPTAGLGLGIDKLAMVYGETSNIKDVIYFPL